ncbi:MAG: hypothetical protein R3B70_10060 [Polyangiaceae bacterium]
MPSEKAMSLFVPACWATYSMRSRLGRLLVTMRRLSCEPRRAVTTAMLWSTASRSRSTASRPGALSRSSAFQAANWPALGIEAGESAEAAAPRALSSEGPGTWLSGTQEVAKSAAAPESQRRRESGGEGG